MFILWLVLAACCVVALPETFALSGGGGVAVGLVFVAVFLYLGIRAIKKKHPGKGRKARKRVERSKPASAAIDTPVVTPVVAPVAAASPAAVSDACEEKPALAKYVFPDLYNDVQKSHYLEDEPIYVPKGFIVKSQLAVNTPISFEKEPDNVYDKYAVAVHCNGAVIGYLYKSMLKDTINDALSAGLPVLGCVSYYRMSEYSNQFFANIALYGAVERKYESKTIVLVGNAKREMQKWLCTCKDAEGYRVSIKESYDYKYRWVVLCAGQAIGYIPAEYNDICEGYTEAQIGKVSDTGHDKLGVKIVVYWPKPSGNAEVIA